MDIGKKIREAIEDRLARMDLDYIIEGAIECALDEKDLEDALSDALLESISGLISREMESAVDSFIQGVL